MSTTKEAGQLVARVKKLEQAILEIVGEHPSYPTLSLTCICKCASFFHLVGPGKRPCINYTQGRGALNTKRCKCKRYRRDWAYDETILASILKRESKKVTESKRQKVSTGCTTSRDREPVHEEERKANREKGNDRGESTGERG